MAKAAMNIRERHVLTFYLVLAGLLMSLFLSILYSCWFMVVFFFVLVYWGYHMLRLKCPDCARLIGFSQGMMFRLSLPEECACGNRIVEDKCQNENEGVG
jgi:hypothetical protein